MKDFKNKICFITGGASGAGLGQAKVFAKAGMKVVIADIRQDALHNAVSEIIEYSGCDVADVMPLCFDITCRKSFAKAAEAVENVYGGPPHLLIQTAGVNSFGPVEASTFDDFDWVMGVCLDAVVNGHITFIPKMIKAYGGKPGAPKEEFHVAITSSMGGFISGAGCGPYTAAKAAANNLIYSYADALAGYGGSATTICPGNINSNIGDAEKYRPEHLRNTGYHVSEGTMAHLRSVHAGGIDPVELAEILKEAIENGRIIALPFADTSMWPGMLRGMNENIEDYLLTADERKAKFEERMAKMPPPEGGGWEVPEGAERFGMARADLDFVDDSKKAQ